MRIGESFGEACRKCGSTQIIVDPPSSSGRCAVCSHEAVDWALRVAHAARRQQAMEQRAMLAAAAGARALHRAERAAHRRASAIRWAREAGAAAAHFVRELPTRTRGASQA